MAIRQSKPARATPEQAKPTRATPEQAAATPSTEARYAAMFMELEARIAFDGAGAETVEKTQQGAHDGSAPASTDAASGHHDIQALSAALALAHPGPAAESVHREALAERAPQAAETVPARGPVEIVFVDPTVEGTDQLVAGISGNFEVVVLDAGQDGVAQIAAALSGRRDVSALHIISHGNAGMLSLGTATLDSLSMAGEHAQALKEIGKSLSADADILVYGCNFGEGTRGAVATDLLGRLTGADIAASTDLTGAADRQGNWVLERQTGQIESRVAIDAATQAAFEATLNASASTGKGAFVVVVGRTFYSVDATTGKATAISTAPGTIGSIDVSNTLNSLGSDQANGLIYFTDSASQNANRGLFAYDYVNNSYLLIDSDLTDNGAGRSLVVGSSGLGGGAAAFANNALFLGVENVSGNDDQIYRLTFNDNGRTLAAISTFGALVGGGNNWGDFALDPAKNVLLSISGGDATITRYDLASGEILSTVTGSSTTFQGGGDAEGNAYLVGASFQQIDPVTGALIGSAITITTNGTNPLGAPSDATTFTPQTGMIGDRVFDDNNLDGVFGAGDTGLSGVTVQLIDDVNGNGTADAGERALATDTTDAAGRYLFTSVLPGAYVVRISDAGGVLGTAPATTGTTKAVTISRVGGSDLSADFGYNARPPLIDLDGGTPTAIALTGSSSSRDVVSGGTFSGASPNIALFGSADNAFSWNFTVAAPLDVAGTRAVLNLSTIERSFKIAVNGSAIHSATDFQLVADSRSTGEVLLRFADGAEVASPQLANTNRLPRVQVVLTPQGIEFWGTRTTSSTVLERLVPDSGTVTLPVFVQGGNTIDFINTGGNYASSVSGTLTVTAPDFDYATSYSENGASVSVGGPQLSVFDPDSTTLASAVVTLTNAQSGDLLVIDGALPSGIRVATDTSVAGRITVTLSGTASRASYEAAIRQVHYLSTSDAPPTVSRTVTVNVSDGGLLSNTATTTIAVMAVNDAPVNGLPAGFTTGENTRLTLSGLSISDADAASGTLTVTLGVGSGTLTAASGGGVTVSGSGSATLTLTGTLSGLNAFLAGASAPVFVPVANASGPVTLTMTTRDNGNTGVGGSLSDTDTTTITVAQVNDAPVNTLPAGYSGTEDNRLTLTGLSIADSDAGSGMMTVTLAVASGSLGAVSGGGVVVSGSGTGTLTLSGTLANLNAYLASAAAPVYVPATDVNGPVTLTMTTNDGGNTGPGGPMSDVDSVAITLAAVNDAPVIDVDARASGTGTAVAYAENGAGVAVVSANLSVSDVDNANLTSATIVIANAQAGDLLAISGTLPSGISASYDGATATLTLSGSASKAAYAAALGQVRFLSTSENPSTVSRSINIAVSDGALGSNVAVATVSVTAVNDAPVAGADSFSTDDKTAVTLDVLANDRDVDGGSLQVTEVDGTPISAGGPAVSVTGGRVALNADGTLTFTPTTPYSGNPSFRYTVSDGQGGTATGTVSGTVSSIETAPVAADDRIATTEDTPVTFDVRLNDSDRDSDPLAVTAIDGQSIVAGGSVAVSGGSIRLNVDGTLTFTLTADVNGPVRFGYTISDGRSGTASATALIEVAAVQDAPRLGADSFSASEDGTATIAVLANDSDPDGDTLTITAIDGTAIAVGGTVATVGGTVTLNADGTLRFVPAADFNGPVSFSYAVSDGQGNVSTANVSGTIIAVNDAPMARADSFVTAEDTAVVIDVLGNDSDVDRDEISVIEINGTSIVAGNTLAVAGGRVTLNADGTLTFTPDADVNGPVGFSYTVSDGKGGSATASVSGSVTAVNDAPVVRADNFTTAEDTALVLTPLQNDADPEGDALAITAIDGQSIGVGGTVNVGNGTVTLNADGSLTFRPAADYNGPIRFAYTVSDGSLSTSATVSGTVTAVNDAPTASDASLSTAEDTTVSGQLPAAIDADGDTPIYALGTTAPASGTVTISPGGAYTYTPKANFNGTDRFSYSVSDAQGGSREYTVAVTVTAVNDTPTSTAMPNRMRLDGEAESFDVSQYFTDADGDRLTFSQTGLPAGLTISAGGQVTGTIDRSASRGGPNGDGVYTVTITATDPSGATVTGTYTAVVTNPAPVAVDDAAVTSEDVPVSFNVLDGTASGGSADRDPDGDPIRLVSASAAHGTVAFTPDGAMTYTPNADYTGRDTITYVIADADGGTATAMVAVTVVSVNDQPIGTGIPDRTRTDGQPERLDASAFFSDPDGDTLTYTASGLPAGLAIDPQTGLIFGTIDAGASGATGVQVYAITITARDGLTNSDGSPSQASVTFNYTVVNIPPDARDDSATTAEETAVDIDVRDNDRDADNDTLTIVRVNGTALTLGGPAVATPNGTVTLVTDANGRAVLRFVPKLDFTGTESFDYTLADPNGGEDSAAVTVRVTGTNDAPRATGPAPALTAVDGESIDRNLAPLFTDVDGDVLTFTASNLPVGLSLDAAGRLTGTIDRAASQVNGGLYQVVITATDPSGASQTQSFQWTVANPPPLAVNDVATTVEDSAVDIAVLDNDSDPDGDPLTVIAASAAHGTVTFQNGVISYRPNADFNGSDTIFYTVSDDNGGTASASVTVTVTAVNDAPSARPLLDRTDSTNETIAFEAGSFFSDVDGDALTFAATGLPPGLAFDSATGRISGVLDVTATVGNTYRTSITADDGRGGTVTRSFDWTVAPTTPEAVDDNNTAGENQRASGNVLTNDLANGGATLRVTAVEGVGNQVGAEIRGSHGGRFIIRGDGSYSFDSGADFDDLKPGESRTTVVSYEITDTNGTKDTATLTVTVGGANDTPTASTIPDHRGLDGQSLTDKPVDVSVFFRDPDGDSLTFAATGLPDGLTLDAAGRITGTISADASLGGPARDGVYSITITATDPDGQTTSAVLRYSVTNPAPVAVDDAATTAEDTAVVINVLDGTAGGNARDSDPDGDTLTVVSAAAANGTVDIGTGGSLTYRPNADFNGADTITYRISDGQGGFATGFVAVTVTAVNDAPVETRLPALVRNDGAPVSFDLSGSFRDVDGDMLTYDVTGLPPGLSFNPATGMISGTIAANASGATGSKDYVLVVTATDGRGGSASFSSTLTVTNIAPVAAFDTRTTAEDTPLDIDVLANDSDPDGDPIGIVSVNGTAITRGGGPVATAHGQIELVDTAVGGVLRTVLRYTPNADFNGTDSFSYGIADDNGGTASASITVTVEAGNDAPTAATIPARSGVDGGLVRFELANAFSDPDGDTLTYSATGLPDGLTIDAATGVVSGHLKADASQVGRGVYRVTVTASDGQLGVDRTFTYTIANPAPTAGNDRVTTTEDTPVSFDPITGANTVDGVADVDPDGDPLTITAINGVAIADGGSVVLAQGTITRSGASQLTFTPNPNANGTQSFVYQISDGQGGTADAVVTIAIAAVGDAASVDLNGPAAGVDYAASFNEGDAPVRLADAAAAIIDAEDDIVALQLMVTGAGRDGAAEIIRLGGSVAFVSGTAASGTIVVGGTNFAFRYDGAGGLAIASAAGDGTAMPAADLQALIGSLRYENTSDNPTAGVRSFAFTATDSAGLASPTATTSITVAGANDAPIARPDTATTDANTRLGFGGSPSLLVNDSDPEGDVLTVSAVGGASAGVGAGVTGSSGGQFVIRADGRYSFDPGADFKDLRAGETRTTSVVYTVSDGAGGTAEAVLSVTVTGLNDAPVGADLSISLQEDGSASGTLPLASDVDGDALRYAVATAPAHGTVSISLNGDYTYVPFADFNGADSFTYTVNDGTRSVFYTVSVTVAAVNDGPTGPTTVPDLALQDAARTTVSLAGYFSDADGDTLVYTASNLPAGLTLDRTTGVLSGTVDAGASQLGGGRYAVVIQATDAAGAFATARFTIVVTNPPPIAIDDRVTTSQDSTVSGSVLADNGSGADRDPDGDALMVSSVAGSAAGVGAAVAGSAGGSFTLNADGTYRFAPGTDFISLGAGETRATSIRYAISDGQGGTAEAVLTVTVAGTDDPPVGAATRFTATEDTAYSGTLPAASDPDGDRVVYGIGTPPAHGDLQVRVDGTFRYTPAADYHGPDSFTYTVTSGGVTVPYTVTVDVTAVNDVPVAADDDFTVAENGTATLAVLGNDRDADGDRLAVTEIDGVAIAIGQSRTVTGGSVTLEPDGRLTFTATPGYSGPARFSYTVSDGPSRAIGTVSGAVTAVNDAPVNTLPATFNAVEDSPLRLTGLSVADADAGSNPISVTLDVSLGTLTAIGAGGVRVGGSGTAHLTLTGTLASINGFLAGVNAPVYQPAQDATGTVRLTMTTNDGGNAGAGGAQSASSVADILLDARNDLPTASDVSLTTKVGQPVSGAILGRDVDGDALTYRLVAQPLGGTVRLDPDGRFSFTPAPNFAGQARFEVTLDDGQGGTATVRVVVDVTRPNEAPVGSDVSAATREDEPLTGRLPVAVDAEGAPLTYALAADAANGRAVVRADGSYTYTPNADFDGSDSFTYSVSDGTTAVVYTVTVSVAAVNDAPVVTSPTRLSAIEDRPLSGAILARDVDGDPVTFTLAAAPAHGSVVVNADGTFTYTPAADFNGGDSFAVAVSDGRGGTRIETFSVSVADVPDLPVTGADSFTVPEDGTVTLDVTGNDRDPDGTALTVTEIDGRPIAVSAPVRIASGMVALNPDGTLSFTPSPNYNGPAGFSYTVRNAAGLASTGSVGGAVAAINDAPMLPPLRIDAVAGGPTTGTLGGFDPDGDPLVYTVTQAPRNGTLTLTADGRYSYVPTPGYTGPDSFSFSVSDGTATVTGSATIGVRPGRTEPVTVDIDVPAPGPDANASSRTIGRPVRSVDADGEVLVAVGSLGSIDAGPVGQRSLDNAIDAMQDLNGLAGMPADELIARTVRAQTDWRETGGRLDGFSAAPFLGGSDIGQLLSQRDGTSFIVDTTINEGVLYVMVAASETREGARIGHETRVTLADGRALPAWLSSQNGGVVFGYPPAGLETMALKVQAVDENGAVSQSVITIDVRSGAVTENLRGDKAAAAGAALFSQQLRAELADIGEGIVDLYNALRF